VRIGVDRGVLAAATELFEARQYPGVIAMCEDALDAEPECVPLLLMRARAHIALRRDLEAQADLRDIIRLDPQCALAYRLLGELAARRDENESAAIFFREALRLDPGDREATDWLQIVDHSPRPAAAVKKLPAPAAAAGRFPSSREREPRFAHGTQSPPPEERVTEPYRGGRKLARGSQPPAQAWQTPTPEPLPLEPPYAVQKTLRGPILPERRVAKPMPRGPTPELPGFGEYLVSTGILTRERLRAAQAYQRSMKVQLSTAIVTLGLATPQRIEWAAVAHQSQLARERQA
jgi:tetratricopeptide (TPR) repeat protein